MNTSSSSAPAKRFLGTVVLAGSLFAALTGCAGEEASSAAQPGATQSSSATQVQESAEAKEFRGTVVSLVDGDTVEVQPVDENAKPNGEPNLNISMLGVKAPAASACGGPEAVAYLQSLLPTDQIVTVTFDPSQPDARDEEGNALAYVSTTTSVSRDIGRLVITEGHAVAWQAPDAPEHEQFQRYEKENSLASEAGKGLWASCGGVES